MESGWDEGAEWTKMNYRHNSPKKSRGKVRDRIRCFVSLNRHTTVKSEYCSLPFCRGRNRGLEAKQI